MTDLAKRTWPEAEALFGEGTVALLPVGSTEPHGPHLPLDTDVTIAVAQARRAASLLDEAGLRTMVLPAVPYGITRWTEGFAGKVSLRPGTLWAILEDIVLSLEQDGVRRIVFVNGHLEPEHVEILRGVALDHPGRVEGEARVVFADNTRRAWAESIGGEFAGGDCHAGRYESSIVLAADPSGVREDERGDLPEVSVGLLEKMREGATSFREAGAERAYCGDPASASADEGEELIGCLAELTAATVRDTWPELFE
ncbi:MAG: creatininase family protein [Planctomycetota bacterium]|jgi:creatinine amidohydrolase|nr:creatininase family protein [Planctomycetota bacterium]MDP6763203.1 creatininase family protein [Planctomycetota bacterium]MDP6990588.1 creatininase family protein [Planctomycetota bacterium]